MSCTQRQELGSAQNPLKFAIVPGKDIQALETDGKEIQKFLEQELGLKVELHVPTSYIAVVESLGSQRADFAIMNSFGYLLANEKFQAEAHLITLSHGRDFYFGEILTHVDSKIDRLEQLDNKTFAYVDPASTSGYLLPQDLFQRMKIKPKDIIFAGRHDAAVSMVYQKRVTAAAAFYSPPEGNIEMDARRLIKTQYPDVFEKVKILAQTGPIPNDPVVFRKDLPENLKQNLIAAFIKMQSNEKAMIALKSLYNITGVKPTTDRAYDELRAITKRSGKSIDAFIKK